WSQNGSGFGDAPQGTPDEEEEDAGEERRDGHGDEELAGGRRAGPAGGHAREGVGDAGAHEPDAHPPAGGLLWRHPRPRREADRAQAELGAGVEEVQHEEVVVAGLAASLADLAGGEHDKAPGGDEDEAEAELVGPGRIFVTAREEGPDRREDRREEDDERRVDALPVARREREAEDVVLRVAVGEEVEGRARLLEDREEEGGAEEEREDGDDAAALARRPLGDGEHGEEEAGGDEEEKDQRAVGDPILGELDEAGGADDGDEERKADDAGDDGDEALLVARGLGGVLGRRRVEAGVLEPPAAGDVLDDAEGHADGGGAEAEVPGGLGRDAGGGEPTAEGLRLGEEADGVRRGAGADVDAHVVDREAGVAPLVLGRVELADDRRDIGLQEPGAERDEDEADEEGRQGRDGEEDVPHRDGDAAPADRLALADEAVGGPATDDRSDGDRC